jgi:predicted nucleic acid-binding protein
VELLAGVSSSDRVALRRGLSALPLLYPTDETWHRIDECVERAAARGQRFGVGDLLIAALASEVDALLWSHDRDFERLERLGFVRIYQP